jgi:tryptophanyl-tRNA synthetase
MERILSGIQPSGAVHLGNYIGALRQWVELQQQYDSYFCIVDYHAITVKQDPDQLFHNTLSLAAMYIAVGLDPQRVTLFRQSDVSAHTELAWIFNTMAYMGELERMTQYKDKAKQHKTNNNVGLFTYPLLMASDILLYQPKYVPVGEDQKQHIELTRELAERFNNRFGDTFVIPEYFKAPQGARIMSLDDPTKKMSKSATTELGYIALTDSPEVVLKKLKKAVTDSGSEVKAHKDKPAVSNLLTIFSAVTNRDVQTIEDEYLNQGYGRFKTGLADAIVELLRPMQATYNELMDDIPMLQRILQHGADKAKVLADQTLHDVKDKLGIR